MADNDVQINFGANTAALAAGSAAARAQLNAFNADAQRIAQTMISSGRTTDEVYVGALAHARSEATALSGVLKSAGVNIAATGAHAISAGAGLGFYAREARAMADELASGRFRNFDGTLINFAVHGAQAAAAFAAANPVLTAVGLAAAAAAGTIGLLAYQANAAGNAMRSIQLDASIAQFQLSAGAARDLRDQIEQLAGVSTSAASDIAKPFLALGPAGEIIAKLVSPLLPTFAQQMGETAPKAADKLIEYFTQLTTKGRELVASTNGVTAAQMAQFDQDARGENVGKAYLAVIEALRARVADYTKSQNLATAATKDQTQAFQDVESGAVIYTAAQGALTASTDEATASMKAQEASAKALESTLATMPTTYQKIMQEGEKAHLEVGSNAAIEKTKATIKQLDDQLKALGASGQVSGAQIGAGMSTAERLTQHLMQTYQLTREQAVGAVGVMGYESGNFQTLQERNPTSGRGGYGYAQWTGPRRTDFENFAAGVPGGPSSYEANQGFLDQELQGRYKGAIPALKATSTPQDAAAAFLKSFEGMVEGGPGVPATAQHQARAQQYYDQGVGAAGGGSPLVGNQNVVGPASAEQSAQIKQILADRDQELAKLYQLQAAQRGVTASAQTELTIAQQGASSSQNQVAMAQQRLTAANAELATAQQGQAGDVAITAAKTKVAEAQNAVTEATNRSTEATARLAAANAAVVARATGDYAKERDAALAVEAAKMKAAGDNQEEQARISEEILAINSKYSNEVMAETIRTNEGIVKAAEETAASRKSALDAQLKEHNISEQQWLQQTTAALNTERAAVAAGFDAEIAAAQNDYSRRVAIEQQKAQTISAINQQIQSAQQQSAESVTKMWTDATGAIKGAIDSQVTSVLTGKESLAKAAKNVLTDLTSKAIQFTINTALDAAIFDPLKSLLGIGNPGQIANTLALNTLTAALTGHGAVLGVNTAGLGINSGATTLNTGTTLIGTASTDTLAAVTLPNTLATIGNTVATQAAAVAHFLGFASGTPYVPKTMLALVHEGEQIIPAALNPLNSRNKIGSFETGAWSVPPEQLAYMRSRGDIVPTVAQGSAALAQGGTGSPGSRSGGAGAVSIHPTTNFHVSAIDSGSFGNFMRDNSAEVSRAMEQAARHGAFLGSRRLSGR